MKKKREKLGEFGSEMSGDPKAKIRVLVQEYKELFKDEFQLFLDGIKGKADMQETDFGEAKRMDYVDRVLYEIPATLDTMFNTRLNSEEMKYYKSKEGARWFAKAFREFTIVNKL